ncbi:hypothetical protein KI809_18825 [Geobacter pelophilus]|uniref:Uncharacterized protein n=1 Tax=Geoanaerobacter pelophilus TaxID=60036 RepID=A0AAW4LEM7_9BACT|nr:hypothetical protein [Geoanaerobacter pelophilus]MBT0666367.1 hypothetical protein [Geoanaerobacter pelophilus]
MILPPDKREEYEERAAIMEYCGGMPRREAENEAWRLVLESMKEQLEIFGR